MFQKIEDVNLLKLMKDIKGIINLDQNSLKTEDYDIKLYKAKEINCWDPLKKLLDIMVKDNYLITELFFQSEDDFEKTFNIKYTDEINKVINSIRIEEIIFQDEEDYSGTFIYHEKYDEKLIFQLSCVKYLSRFQSGDLWE